LFRFFGFTFKVKKEPRWVDREALTDIHEILQELQDRMEALEKRAEANRTRISQLVHKNPEAADILGLGNQPKDEITDILQRRWS
jgi:hypothetical protein